MRKWVFDFCKKLIASMVLIVCMVLTAIGLAISAIAGLINLLAYTIDSDVTKWFTNWLFKFGRWLSEDNWGSMEDEIV